MLGPKTAPVELALGPATALIGVQFAPGGAYPFLRSLLHALADGASRSTPLGRAPPRCPRRWPGCPGCGTGSRREGRPVVRRALGLLGAARTPASVRRAAADLGISPRHLARLFLAEVGVPPKLCARLMRFQRVVRLLGRRPRAPSGELVGAGGYYDQAHLIREFRAFAGLSPDAYRRGAQRVRIVQYGRPVA